ncbi:hypothetical protein [Serinicoccus sediminis]|uniref:hypothetical protein n=1 Tax=Serinicoccus sediminis TaxID=2306021 RepID=UPI00102200A7|nr:hypothetical protein [Serinicoccus sediminis]
MSPTVLNLAADVVDFIGNVAQQEAIGALWGLFALVAIGLYLPRRSTIRDAQTRAPLAPDFKVNGVAVWNPHTDGPAPMTDEQARRHIDGLIARGEH